MHRLGFPRKRETLPPSPMISPSAEALSTDPLDQSLNSTSWGLTWPTWAGHSVLPGEPFAPRPDYLGWAPLEAHWHSANRQLLVTQSAGAPAGCLANKGQPARRLGSHRTHTTGKLIMRAQHVALCYSISLTLYKPARRHAHSRPEIRNRMQIHSDRLLAGAGQLAR